MAKIDASPADGTNRRRGAWLGFGIALALVALMNGGDAETVLMRLVMHAPLHRGWGFLVPMVGSVGFIAASAWIGGRAAVATGRQASGGGVRHGATAALFCLVVLGLVASASDVASGRKELHEIPIAVFALFFFGLVPALLVGAVGGVALSRMVTRTTDGGLRP
jgi:hypothetical protein